MNERLVNELEKLNFNKVEAGVYLELLKGRELNGSQIAKKMNVSRSSVYAALNNLYRRGVVYLIPGDTNMYRAENPDIMIEKMRTQFEETTTTLQEELLQIEQEDVDKSYYNLSGTQNFINKAKEILLRAEKEVYINTYIDLQIFKKEIQLLAQRGVRIIVFTYSEMNIDGLQVELYKHPMSPDEWPDDHFEIRLMLVVDVKLTLICSTKDENVEMSGTFTEDTLLANIVSEHIHHDIYLVKLIEKHNNQLMQGEVLLNGLLERNGISENLDKS